MTRIGWFVVAAVALLCLSGPVQALDTRQAAPKVAAKTIDGERLNNEVLRGKVVLIQFWTTWCQYCRRDQEAVDAVAKDYADKGLVVIAVNVGESRRKVKQYLESNPRACRIVLTEDTNLAATFAGEGFPRYVVLDREGKAAGSYEGAGGEGRLRWLLQKAGLKEEE